MENTIKIEENSTIIEAAWVRAKKPTEVDDWKVIFEGTDQSPLWPRIRLISKINDKYEIISNGF